MRACDMVTLIKLSKAVWTRAIYKAVFKKKSPCRSRKDGWTLLPDPQVWRRHTGLMHDVIYLTCSPLYFDQTSQLYAELRYLSIPLGACCLDILSQFIQEHSWLFKTIYCNQCNTSTLKPLNWRKFKYPWEDGSFSRRRVHVRGEEDECERLDSHKYPHWTNVIWVMTDRLTISWADNFCVSDFHEFYAELHFRHCFTFSWSSVPWPVARDVSAQSQERSVV